MKRKTIEPCSKEKKIVWRSAILFYCVGKKKKDLQHMTSEEFGNSMKKHSNWILMNQ